MKEDHFGLSGRFTEEDKINTTWVPPVNRRGDGQPNLAEHLSSQDGQHFRFLTMILDTTGKWQHHHGRDGDLCLLRKEPEGEPEESAYLRHSSWTCGGHWRHTCYDLLRPTVYTEEAVKTPGLFAQPGMVDKLGRDLQAARAREPCECGLPFCGAGFRGGAAEPGAWALEPEDYPTTRCLRAEGMGDV